MTQPAAREGWVADALRAELPGLGVVSLRVPSPRRRRSPRGVREHLDVLATRFRGGDALVLRQRPVPHAYRVFYRHIGLDPDATRVPIEAAAVDRLVRGGFATGDLLADACTIALVETGVPVWALDADALDGPLGVRLAVDGERLGRGPSAPPLPHGRIVLADRSAPLGVLFGELAPDCLPTRRTRALELVAVRVDGVSALHVDEALRACAAALGAASADAGT